MSALRQHFALTLMVNHACNLRCSYCYTGAKFSSPMPLTIGFAGINRAFQSMAPGGRLDVGFFGGEPLLEAKRVIKWMTYAREGARDPGKHVTFNLTTNGTLTNGEAWQIMAADDVALAVSFDGTPETHDHHRRDAHGKATAALVEGTIRRLVEYGKEFEVVVVVRPDTVASVPAGLEYLYQIGVRQVTLSLDLWTVWQVEHGVALEKVIHRAAEVWAKHLPELSVNWFDAKAGALGGVPLTEETSRCGFGTGEIAIAPSGRLYPCERVIGEDRPNHPLRLPGHALEGADFLNSDVPLFARCAPCSRCALAPACETTCRCSNFIRTGDVNRPDGLLCLLNKATARSVAEVLGNFTSRFNSSPTPKERCYA